MLCGVLISAYRKLSFRRVLRTLLVVRSRRPLLILGLLSLVKLFMINIWETLVVRTLLTSVLIVSIRLIGLGMTAPLIRLSSTGSFGVLNR